MQVFGYLWGPFYKHGFTSIPVWISNYFHEKAWSKINCPFPNCIGASVNVWGWISNFLSHLTRQVISYLYREHSKSILLTHLPLVSHICVRESGISIGSDNGLSPARRQAITWANAGLLSIGPLGTKCSDILIEIHTFLFKEMRLKVSSGK